MATARGLQAREALPNERRRFDVSEFLRMQEGGVFAEDDHLELVQREILVMPPQGPEHGTLKDELHERLVDAYRGKETHVLNQRRSSPVRAACPSPTSPSSEGAHETT